MSSVELIRGEVSTACDEIRALVRAATPEQLAADSPLPGWDRAHVVAHIAGFAHGMARQLEYAVRGEQIEQYTGGVAGRNADIEERVAMPVGRLKVVLEDALDHLAAAIAAMTESDWSRPISYRQGIALGGLEGAWREVEIHLADLDLGSTTAQWSDAFCAHLFDFLTVRLPAEIVLVLPDGTRVGAGTTDLRAAGSWSDVAAWLAGREPIGALTFAGERAPELGPWPATKH